MAFIHVEDAADALLEASRLKSDDAWQAVNAASEVASIGQVARTVQRLTERHGEKATTDGSQPLSMPETFEVRTRLRLQPRYTLETGLVDVLDYFLARR